MTPAIQNGFDALERQRAALTGDVLTLDDAQLRWTPGTAWSVRQIVEHLVLSDETIGRARDASEVKAEAPMFRVLPRAFRRALILGALKRDAVLPLPSPDIEPRGDLPLPALLSRWGAARAEMRRDLDPLRGDERQYAHPVLGPLTALQMLELSQTHTAYHTRQIQALRRGATFPHGM